MIDTKGWFALGCYLISDLDHTLLNEQGRLSSRTILTVVKSQLPLMLASARMPIQMLDLINQLQLTGPQTALNGAVIFQPAVHEFRVLEQHAIPDQTAQKLQNLVKTEFPELNFTWIETEIFYTGIQPLFDVDQRPLKNVLQILLIIEDSKRLKEVKKRLIANYSNEIAIHEAGDGYLTINAAAVNKGCAARYLIEHELADYDQLVAFGDDENDLPMLKSVAHPVAMANASQSVKESAEIIALSNEEDGIAQIIERIAPNKF